MPREFWFAGARRAALTGRAAVSTGLHKTPRRAHPTPLPSPFGGAAGRGGGVHKSACEAERRGGGGPARPGPAQAPSHNTGRMHLSAPTSRLPPAAPALQAGVGPLDCIEGGRPGKGRAYGHVTPVTRLEGWPGQGKRGQEEHGGPEWTWSPLRTGLHHANALGEGPGEATNRTHQG